MEEMSFLGYMIEKANSNTACNCVFTWGDQTPKWQNMGGTFTMGRIASKRRLLPIWAESCSPCHLHEYLSQESRIRPRWYDRDDNDNIKKNPVSTKLVTEATVVENKL